MLNNRVLLIVDMQQAIKDAKPYRYKDVEKNIEKLLKVFRERKEPVIFIQHESSKGSSFERGTNGWEIVSALKPNCSEIVINKSYNSSFRETTLDSTLKKLGISELVIVGMQTEFCIDTTIRVAFEKGYSVVVPELTNTTIDTPLLSGESIYKHHNSIFKNRFASIKTIQEIIE